MFNLFSTPLQRAIAQGLKPGGDLVGELRKLDDYKVSSRKDAQAIVSALRQFPRPLADAERITSPIERLTALFQDVDGSECPAYDVMFDEGLPELARIFDAQLADADEGHAKDLLFMLKIMAMYGSEEGAERIVRAARKPLKPDDYMWHVAFRSINADHPWRDEIFSALRDPLPPAFIAVSLLDAATSHALEGKLDAHPFDSPAGYEQIQTWLQDSDPEHYSYAHSATATLAFLSNPARDRLLGLAMDHLDAGVQMEAAWVAAKVGREAGLKMLSRFCLDVNHSDVACRYLVELGKEEFIPADVRNPDFSAKAEFARWLAHPNELGKPPTSLEIVDRRKLAWPFWIIRYLLRDETGLEADQVDCGLVGSMTWCFFSYRMDQRLPEDVYAIHCAWEMEGAKLIHDVEVTDQSEYARMLSQWTGQPLQDIKITRIAELSPELKLPARLVALATAKMQGSEGWVVLDGPRSAWYPRVEQPEKTHEPIVLKIHIGRQLLGLNMPADRAKYLANKRPERDPARFVAAYEKLMAEAGAIGTTAKRQKELVGSWSLLGRRFGEYVDAIAAQSGREREQVLIDSFNRFLSLAERVDASVRDDVHDSGSVLGNQFDDYVKAILNRDNGRAEVVRLIKLFSPHWDHNLGYGRLGSAAFRAGDRVLAEPYLQKLRTGLEDYCRSEEMSQLAEIWFDRGETQQARGLLIDCLQKIVTMIKESKYNSDRAMFAGEFQHHRATFLRLFPGGELELAKLGLPVDPLV